MKNSAVPQKSWYKLDNAAKIFPGQNTKTWSNIFRLTAELDGEVQPDILTSALEQTLPRFPCYKVMMKSGFFWHYFVENTNPVPAVMPDIKNPCYRIDFKENDGFLFRVYYRGARVSLDFYHALSDGYGAAVFFNTILAQYYRLLGETVLNGEFVLDINEQPSPGELEDAFGRHADSKASYKRRERFVYHAKGAKMPEHTLNITSGTVSFSELHAITKAAGVTVTEYLAALLMKIHLDKQKNESHIQKEVAIQIPVNLRKAFSSETMRNFTICLRVKIDPRKGEYSFDEILAIVMHQLRLVNSKNELNMIMTANMKLERNPLLRLTPLFIKDMGVAISFFITGEQTTTALFSNLGPVVLPEGLARHVKRLILAPGPGKLNGARCGISTVGDSTVITFANLYRESDIEREFFTALVKKGIHVKIESNR